MANDSKHIWYYQRTTLLTVIDEGPYTDQQMLILAKDGKLKLSTAIRSPTRTKNHWISAETVPAIAVAINQAALDAEAKKKDEWEASRKKRQELALVDQQHRMKAAALANEQLALKVAKEREERAQIQKPELLPALPHPSRFQDYSPGIQQQTTVIVQQNQSNTAAVLLNIFLIPGLGQMTQGRAGIGLVLMLLWFAGIATACMGVGIIIMILVYLIAAVDAASFKPQPVTIDRR
jgi:TM2 domain-containing membrane protein YozV